MMMLKHPLVPDRSHGRTPRVQLIIDERNRYLRGAARFYPGASDREVARRLRIALATYQAGRFRRDRSDLTCPVQHKGKLTAILWMILKVRDAVPSEITIRRALAG
jgi:hypothetical protein